MKGCNITQDFLSYLEHEKHFSVHTAKCYGADLTQFVEFVAANSREDSGEQGGLSHEEANPWSAQPVGTATALETQTETKL